jgi:hypothetical protein
MNVGGERRFAQVPKYKYHPDRHQISANNDRNSSNKSGDAADRAAVGRTIAV